MGAQPGNCIDANTFTLPQHESENLSDVESAERIAAHFEHISRVFPPLDVNCLHNCVQIKLQAREFSTV